MIFPLILTLAAICQVAPASPVEDVQTMERIKTRFHHHFMGCMQESLEELKRLPILKKHVNFSPIPSAPALNTIIRDSGVKPVELIKPVETRIEIKPIESDSLYPLWKNRGYTLHTSNENVRAAPNSLNMNRRAIYVNDSQVTWNEARNRCIDRKAELVIIDSAETETFLIEFLKKHNVTRAWIGVHSLFGDKQWTTIKGDRLESLPYVHWGEHQPDNYGGNERCVVLNQRGMNDLACDSEADCICQWLE